MGQSEGLGIGAQETEAVHTAQEGAAEAEESR